MSTPTTDRLDVRASSTAPTSTPAPTVDAELAASRSSRAVVLRSDGDGHLVVGLAGDFSTADAGAVADLLQTHRTSGRRGLTVELRRLHSWTPALARVLGRARIRHLVHGASVRLRDAPASLLDDLGCPEAVTFGVAVGRVRGW